MISSSRAATIQAQAVGVEAVGCRMACFPSGRPPAIQNFNADLNAYTSDRPDRLRRGEMPGHHRFIGFGRLS